MFVPSDKILRCCQLYLVELQNNNRYVPINFSRCKCDEFITHCSPKNFFFWKRNILTTFKYGYIFCLQGPFSNVIGHSPCIFKEH